MNEYVCKIEHRKEEGGDDFFYLYEPEEITPTSRTDATVRWHEVGTYETLGDLMVAIPQRLIEAETVTREEVVTQTTETA